jgi:predicted DNA-binding transcriptional regulator AlpA
MHYSFSSAGLSGPRFEEIGRSRYPSTSLRGMAPNMKMLRLAEVVEMTNLSRATIYRYESRGQFPPDARWGPHSAASAT